MPGRITPLVSGQIYHVFNRGINHQPTFFDRLEYKRALLVINYYKYTNPPAKLSKFLQISSDKRLEIMANLRQENDKLVEILAFCLMPNHFHLLIKQIKDKGISKFLANFQNSYTRFFNTKRERDGSLFLDQFKAVLVMTDDQLLHISRYIHLNPYTSYVVKDLESLPKYPWSSLPEYLENRAEACEPGAILNFFKNSQAYLNFIQDQASYQRELHQIEHLTLE